MNVYSISEAYVKCLSFAVIERAKIGSLYAMANRLGVSRTKLKNLESLKIIDTRLLDAYMREMNISFKGKVEL